MPTGAKIVYSLCPWCQSLCFNHTSQGCQQRYIIDTTTSFFYIELALFLDGVSVKQKI